MNPNVGTEALKAKPPSSTGDCRLGVRATCPSAHCPANSMAEWRWEGQESGEVSEIHGMASGTQSDKSCHTPMLSSPVIQPTASMGRSRLISISPFYMPQEPQKPLYQHLQARTAGKSNHIILAQLAHSAQLSRQTARSVKFCRSMFVAA